MPLTAPCIGEIAYAAAARVLMLLLTNPVRFFQFVFALSYCCPAFGPAVAAYCCFLIKYCACSSSNRFCRLMISNRFVSSVTSEYTNSISLMFLLCSDMIEFSVYLYWISFFRCRVGTAVVVCAPLPFLGYIIGCFLGEPAGVLV